MLTRVAVRRRLASRLDQCRDLAPKLARIGTRVGFREARSTNPSSAMADDVPVDGMMPLGLAMVMAIDKISLSFDLVLQNLGFFETLFTKNQ